MRNIILSNLRSLSKFHAVSSISVRGLSSATANNLTILDVNEKTGIATLTLNRPPVNGLNLDLLTAIEQNLDHVENIRSKGLILTSSSKSVFSAGLDILEMYKPDPQRCKEFWITLQNVWLKLYGSAFPTIALINGHSPAGGCLLSLSCEYRVMLPNFTIGLNETQLGIVAPKWFMASMKNVLPTRVAEQALTQGKMFSTDEAHSIGLIDEIAQDKEDALKKCENFVKSFSKVSPIARALTKQSFRSKDLQELEETKEQDLQQFLFFINQPKVQKGLEMYLEQLKKKAQK